MIVIGFLSGGGTAAHDPHRRWACWSCRSASSPAAGSQGMERRARRRLAYLGPSPFLVFAAAIPVSLLAVFAVSVPLVAVGIPRRRTARGAAVGRHPGARLRRAHPAAGGRYRCARLAGDGRPALDRLAVIRMAGGALWAVPVILVTAVVAKILLAIFPVTPTSPLPPTGTMVGFILSFVAGALVAPFGEEILFRGFATTAWVRGDGATPGPRRRGAVLRLRARPDDRRGIGRGRLRAGPGRRSWARIPVALALGWLFVRRGTIWASFGLHAAFNGLLLILAEMAVRSI